jgi:hypothetical protein
MASILPDPAAGDINCIQFNPRYRDRVNARHEPAPEERHEPGPEERQKPAPEERHEPGPEEVRIRGPRLTLRPLRSDEIDEEWRAMVTADPMAVAELPDEAAFRARLRRSGRMHDGWLDLAIDLDGTSLGRIQTFVPPGRALPRGTFDLGSACTRTPAAGDTAARRSPC